MTKHPIDPRQQKLEDKLRELVAAARDCQRADTATWLRVKLLDLYDEWKAEGCPGTWPEYVAIRVERGEDATEEELANL
jgi:hypothetical protein